MGVLKLGKFLNDICSIKTRSLTQVFNEPCEVSVDSNIFLYRFIHNSNDDAGYISNIIQFVTNLKEMLLEPIFVIDGQSGKEKTITQNKRRQQRINIRDKMNVLQDKLDNINNIPLDESDSDNEDELKIKIQKMKKKLKKITKHHIDLFKKTLTMLGVTYFHCKGEADPMCAALVKQGIAKFCLTNDNDIIAHGCGLTCQNYRFSNNSVSVYKLDDILSKLDISHPQFIDLCIMLGTDYNDPIYGMTAEIGYQCIKEYGDIETVLNCLSVINNTIIKQHRIKYGKYIKNLKIPDNKKGKGFDYKQVRELFKDDFDIKSYIESTNLNELTSEWINSNDRLLKLETFLKNNLKMSSNEARQKVQLINIIWTSVSYKRNTYVNRYCVYNQEINIIRNIRSKV